MNIIHEKITFIHIKSFIYGHIHPCRWIKITLSFKLQAQSFKFKPLLLISIKFGILLKFFFKKKPKSIFI